MRIMTGRAGLRACVVAAALVLSGCGGAGDDRAVSRGVDFGAAVDPSAFAGEVTFRIAETLPAKGRDVPFELFLGIAPETRTRLVANALVDLRHLQAVLPDLLTGAIEPSCGLGLDLRFVGAEAVGEAVRARASADARVYRCRQRGTEAERRGGRLLSQTIDVDATLSAGLESGCMAFRLVDLDLKPKGVLGGLATLFGVTERARSAILAKARTVLAENPVCPDLPPALELLDPRFATAGLRQIGEGGIGASLSGSVDAGAATLVDLLVLVEARRPRPGVIPSPPATQAGQAAFRVDDSIDVRGTEVGLGLDMRLAALGASRIGIETMLDLRDLQARLPEIVAGEVLVDTCGGRIALQSLEAQAREAAVIATGRLSVETFECARTGPGSWERGELTGKEDVGVRAEMSAELAGQCVVFRLLDLTRDPPGAFAQLETGNGRAAAARALLLEATRLILEANPLCPELPPDLAILDPRFDRGTPQEIGAGGVGVALDGSIDVSPRAIVDLLSLLQSRGALPPPP